ncbi:hypothetical protein Tco_1067745 [Tanacetum coccineum]|uniref:Uncharacterized protein n=1 Tax=Tanacetum coccineum TaxID=301880 RepID=A0ABQ5HDR6_9ASTR
MDPNSSLGKICLGENVVEISSDKVEGSGDWNSPEFQDTANSGGKKEMKAMVFHQMDTEEVSDRFVAPCFINGLEAYDGEINFGIEENMISNEYAVKLCLEHEVKRGNKVVKKELIVALRGEIYFLKAGTITIYTEFDPFLEDIEEEEKRTSSSAGGHLTQEEARKEALAIRISQKFALLVKKDKVELDGKIVKEEEEAIKRIKGEALKEKDDPRAFIFPIRLEGKAEAIGILINVLCQVVVATLIAKFLILDIPIDRDAPIVVGRGFLRTIGGIVNTPERLLLSFFGFCHQTFRAARSNVMRNAESDNDDEEEYEIKRNKFGAPIYGPKPVQYLNCNDPTKRSLAIQTVTNPFRKISVWKKAVSFLGSLPMQLKQVNWKPDYKGSYTKEEEATGQWRTEIKLTDVYGNIYSQRFITKKTDRKLSKYHKLSDIMSPNWFVE